MNKKNSFLSFLVLLSATNFAQINFEHESWDKIKAKAKAENKLIFLDAYTSWCGPCKWMSSVVFTNDTVGKFYNSTFINSKFDMEKGEGLELAKKYAVRVYPTLLYINGDGELVHRGAGGRPAAQFIGLGKDAQNPEKCFASLDKKYQSGNYDYDFFSNYVATLNDMYLDSKSVLENYFSKQKESDLSNAENWSLLKRFVETDDNAAFQYVLSHTEEFNKKYSVDTVNAKIATVYENALMNLIYAKKLDEKKYSELKIKVEKLNLPKGEKIMLSSDVEYYKRKEDFVNFSKVIVPFIEKYNGDNPMVLNDAAWTIYEKSKDKALLERAESWAKRGCEISENDPAIMDTYACLMFKNGKKAEAIELESKALEMLKKDPNTPAEQLKSYEDNIAKWKK